MPVLNNDQGRDHRGDHDAYLERSIQGVQPEQ
jgi:hypothetical protein